MAKHQQLILNGKKYYLLPRAEYHKIMDVNPAMPARLPSGNYPAAEALRVSIARQIIDERNRLGLSQKELADASGVPVATLNRIERATRTPHVSTMGKIETALKKSQGFKPTGARKKTA
jgi:ribosome-binding protein aMBF1 (putative translation factor)